MVQHNGICLSCVSYLEEEADINMFMSMWMWMFHGIVRLLTPLLIYFFSCEIKRVLRDVLFLWKLICFSGLYADDTNLKESKPSYIYFFIKICKKCHCVVQTSVMICHWQPSTITRVHGNVFCAFKINRWMPMELRLGVTTSPSPSWSCWIYHFFMSFTNFFNREKNVLVALHYVDPDSDFIDSVF